MLNSNYVMKNIKLLVNVILFVLFVLYVITGYLITDGRQILYMSDSIIDYYPIILTVIILFTGIGYGRYVLRFYKLRQRKRAALLLLLTIILMTYFLYAIVQYYCDI